MLLYCIVFKVVVLYGVSCCIVWCFIFFCMVFHFIVLCNVYCCCIVYCVRLLYCIAFHFVVLYSVPFRCLVRYKTLKKQNNKNNNKIYKDLRQATEVQKTTPNMGLEHTTLRLKVSWSTD